MGSQPQDAKSRGRADRAERLSSALRDNLRRRKAQARQRREADAGEAVAAEADRSDSETAGDDRK